MVSGFRGCFLGDPVVVRVPLPGFRLFCYYIRFPGSVQCLDASISSYFGLYGVFAVSVISG